MPAVGAGSARGDVQVLRMLATSPCSRAVAVSRHGAAAGGRSTSIRAVVMGTGAAFSPHRASRCRATPQACAPGRLPPSACMSGKPGTGGFHRMVSSSSSGSIHSSFPSYGKLPPRTGLGDFGWRFSPGFRTSLLAGGAAPWQPAENVHPGCGPFLRPRLQSNFISGLSGQPLPTSRPRQWSANRRLET